MIPVSSSTLDSGEQIDVIAYESNWQKELASSHRTLQSLLNHVKLKEEDLPYALDQSAEFKLKVTRSFADLIEKGNPFDPLLLQVIPRLDERKTHPDFQMDPLDESSFQPTPGLVHKYKNRALLIAHQACAIHCRYCFRRHFPYSEARLNKTNLQSSLAYIRQYSDIEEIILSGGDPLSLSDKGFTELAQQLETVEQLTTLRIHSRTPVLLPSRITEEFVKTLQSTRFNVVLVLHINHANEISPVLIEKLQYLKNAGVTLLNQSVLLRGVNNEAEILCDLSRRLFDAGVLPYYLHSLDPVSGTHHFQVSKTEAETIWLKMQQKLSGYLLPRLVQERPHKQSKTWINPRL